MAYTSRASQNIAPYAVGNKVYGGGRSFPTMGPVDRTGYKERDAKSKARREALERRIKARSNKNYASSDALRKV